MAQDEQQQSTPSPSSPPPATPRFQRPPPATESQTPAPRLGVSRPTPSNPTSPGRDSATDSTGPATAPDPIEALGDTRSFERDESVTFEVSAEVAKDAAREAVLGASMFVHNYLARTDLEQAAGVWIATDKDLDAIATPLGSLAKRHTGGDVANPDVADLFAIGIGIGLYIAHNARAAFAARKAQRAAMRADTEHAAGGAE